MSYSRRSALVIGCNYSSYSSTSLPTLKGACNDARDMAKMLCGPLYEYNVTLMTDDDCGDPKSFPSLENVYDALLYACSSAIPGDHLVIFFSGIGTRCVETEDQFKDNSQYGAIVLADGGVLPVSIIWRLTRLLKPQVKLTVFVDAPCCAAFLDVLGSIGPCIPVPRDHSLDPLVSKWVQPVRYSVQRWGTSQDGLAKGSLPTGVDAFCMTACGPGEGCAELFRQDSQRFQGVFTAALLAALHCVGVSPSASSVSEFYEVLSRAHVIISSSMNVRMNLSCRYSLKGQTPSKARFLLPDTCSSFPLNLSLVPQSLTSNTSNLTQFGNHIPNGMRDCSGPAGSSFQTGTHNGVLVHPSNNFIMQTQQLNINGESPNFSTISSPSGRDLRSGCAVGASAWLMAPHQYQGGEMINSLNSNSSNIMANGSTTVGAPSSSLHSNHHPSNVVHNENNTNNKNNLFPINNNAQCSSQPHPSVLENNTCNMANIDAQKASFSPQNQPNNNNPNNTFHNRNFPLRSAPPPPPSTPPGNALMLQQQNTKASQLSSRCNANNNQLFNLSENSSIVSSMNSAVNTNNHTHAVNTPTNHNGSGNGVVYFGTAGMDGHILHQQHIQNHSMLPVPHDWTNANAAHLSNNDMRNEVISRDMTMMPQHNNVIEICLPSEDITNVGAVENRSVHTHIESLNHIFYKDEASTEDINTDLFNCDESVVIKQNNCQNNDQQHQRNGGGIQTALGDSTASTTVSHSPVLICSSSDGNGGVVCVPSV